VRLRRTEGAQASKITIDVAELPASGLEFGVTITEPADGSSVSDGESVAAGGSYAFPESGYRSNRGWRPSDDRSGGGLG
jgi:hypothetical protein